MRLIVIFLLIGSATWAQPTIIDDTLTLPNGLKFVVGQDLNFGAGSNMATKEFNFIYTSPMSILAPPTKLGSGWANMKMKIHDFKKYGTRKTGDKYYIVLSGGNIVKYWCEIVPALDSKEVIVQGFNDSNGQPSAPSRPSKAEELKKWKDLLDAGAITKEEYEAEKKKILERQEQ